MKTVLITGANGYIGRHVTQALSQMGAEIIALDYSEGVEVPFASRTLHADILSPDFSAGSLFDVPPDACLHLAWRNGFSHNAESHMNDLSGHCRFLEGLAQAGVGQIAVMGSMHEVGYWEGAIDQDTPCNPESYYGIAKDALRRFLLLLASKEGFCAQWLRGFYIYGDDENSSSVFGKLLAAAGRGDATFPFTSGRNLYDFISVDELAAQIAACVMQDEVCGIINCCSGNPVSLADQMESFIARNGLSIELDYGAYPDRPYDSPGVWGDASTIKLIMSRQDAHGDA